MAAADDAVLLSLIALEIQLTRHPCYACIVYSMKHKSGLPQAREAAIRTLPPWEQIIRGSLIQYRRTCGNRGCRCYRGARRRHGPYWYLAVRWARGRQKLYPIPKALIPGVRRGLAAYRKLWEEVYRIAEINLDILRTRYGRVPAP